MNQSGMSVNVVIFDAYVTSISEEAFSKCSKLTIVTPAGSYAEQYAKDHFIVCHTKSFEKITKEYDEQYITE